MGLYMSDFLSVTSEATLYKILDRLPLSTWPILLQALQQTIDFCISNEMRTYEVSNSLPTDAAAVYYRSDVYKTQHSQRVRQLIENHAGALRSAPHTLIFDELR